MFKKIRNGKLNAIENSPKQVSKYLIKDHKWDPNDAKRIWCFGVENNCNVLVDQTKSASYLREIKDHLINAFKMFVGMVLYVENH